MVRGGAKIWPLRVCVIACCAVMPWFAGTGYAVFVLLALPILRALLDAMHEHLTARLSILGGCVCAGLLLPGWLWPAIAVWGLGLMAFSLVGIPPGTRTFLSGALLAAAGIVALLALAALRAEGPFILRLSQYLVDWIDHSPNSTALLLNAYQSGLARLEGAVALMPAIRIFQAVIIPPDVRLQLLYSLRTSLEILLDAYLPRWLVDGALLMALLPTLAAEAYLHSSGRRSDLPPLGQWLLPERLSVFVTALLLMGFLPYLTDAPLPVYLGTMCNALGFGACALQGASFLVAVLTGRGVRPVLCGLIIALGAAILPIGLFFLGAYDQFFDPRHLRGSHDEMI